MDHNGIHQIRTFGKAYGRLKTPVDRILYVKGTAQIEHPIASGIRALARQSMIGVNDQDGAIAISKKEAAKIPAEDICTKQYFEDFGVLLLKCGPMTRSFWRETAV